MVTFEPKIYKYNTSVEWVEGHEGNLISANKHPIRAGCPPEFGGKVEYWSPEELFVASAELCIMTTFLDLCKRSHFSIVSYWSKAEGSMHIIKGEFRFSQITILPVVIVTSSNDLEKAAKFIKQAGEKCVISHSVKTDVHIEPEITIANS